jgi:hypothetical protein
MSISRSSMVNVFVLLSGLASLMNGSLVWIAR